MSTAVITESRSRGDEMKQATTMVARVRAWGGDEQRNPWARALILLILTVLVVPLLMMVATPSAFADDEDPDNYSLYQLASNASTYFGEKNSPAGDGMTDEWKEVTTNPSSGGSLLGYADPDFSVGDIVGWFFAEVSGSSQTIMYSTFESAGGDEAEAADYSGMLDYAHFGAANRDLGLDTMSSGIGGQIVNVIGGSIVWVLYALALAVGTVFYIIIQFLKLVNPFLWFYQAVKGVTGFDPATTNEWADGMTNGQGSGTVLAGLQSWIASWYNVLQQISWQALVPLFIGFLLIGLVLFKKMDRGSAIKKVVVRIIFIGLGLPILGSMYTSVLDQFDDSLLGSHSGPTRVVLSNYVDFDAWMMNNRLAVPDNATIGWDGDQATSDSMMSVRTSALAINVFSHGDTYKDMSVGDKTSDAETSWKQGTVSADDGSGNDVNSVFTAFGIINDYITSREVAASDFESGIKSQITNLELKEDTKKSWFVDDKTYGDVDKFGEGKDPVPAEHPVIASTSGLTSSNPGADQTTFTSRGTQACGFSVVADKENPASCNLAPLAAYNYLNTDFGPDSLTMYSSNNATSGFTRESHMAVSQVGTGPAKFMYWGNMVVVLGCIVLLGFWYAIGMAAGSIKRTFSLIAAIPFATLGAIAAIAKVIVYTTAMILEVLVTLFMYQFVSELLIGIPGIIAGPLSNLMTEGGLFGSALLGGIVVVILTLISTLIIIGVTFGLLRVRKVVLQAMDEAVTKLVDKFLDTNTAPKPDKGGMLPSLASGVGAGAGMAAGQKLASMGSNKFGGGGSKSPGKGSGATRTPSTNAGGTNGPSSKQLAGGGSMLALGQGGSGDGPGEIGPGGGDGGPGGRGPLGPGGSGGEMRQLSAGGSSGSDGKDGGSGGQQQNGEKLALAGGAPGTSHRDRQTAQGLNAQGGLSNLGYGSPGQRGGSYANDKTIPGELASGTSGSTGSRGGAGQHGQQGQSSQNGQQDTGGTIGTSKGRKALVGSTTGTQFGTSGSGSESGQNGETKRASHFTGSTQGALVAGSTSGPGVKGSQQPGMSGTSQPGTPSTTRSGSRPGQSGTSQPNTPGTSQPGTPGTKRPGSRQGQPVNAATSFGRGSAAAANQAGKQGAGLHAGQTSTSIPPNGKGAPSTGKRTTRSAAPVRDQAAAAVSRAPMTQQRPGVAPTQRQGQSQGSSARPVLPSTQAPVRSGQQAGQQPVVRQPNPSSVQRPGRSAGANPASRPVSPAPQQARSATPARSTSTGLSVPAKPQRVAEPSTGSKQGPVSHRKPGTDKAGKGEKPKG